MPRHATLTRLGDRYEDAKQIAVVVGGALAVITLIAVLAIPAFGAFIQLWSGRWPW